MQRPRLVFRCQYPTTEKLGMSPQKCPHVPFRCRVLLKIQLSSLHKTAAPVCAHMLLQLLYFTQNNRRLDQLRKCMHYFAIYKKPEPLKVNAVHTYQCAVFKQTDSRTLPSRSTSAILCLHQLRQFARNVK